jgi:dTDP-4-amino-4,6-dideoxygalactose transaminase
LAYNSGTSAIHGALFGCRIGRGDEVICISAVYWASVLPVLSFGAVPVFAEILPNTLCIDPADFERKITDKTKAVIAVHNFAHPAEMDRIMAVAKKYGVKVIEDVSHAQGGLYKNKKLGTFGDVAAMSLMSGKSLACGEAGMLTTDDTEIYERAIAYGHYERYDANKLQTGYLREFAGLPLGGHKQRMHQASSAMGRVQLKRYDERAAEIRRAMNYFWDCLEHTPGMRAHRTDESAGSTMGGWYAAHGLYVPEELGNLSLNRFCQAAAAEGVPCSPGINAPLHLHPLLFNCDIYGDNKPTRTAFSKRESKDPEGSLPVSEAIHSRTYYVPWFKKYKPDQIEQYAAAFRKVCENFGELLAGDEKKSGDGRYFSF